MTAPRIYLGPQDSAAVAEAVTSSGGILGPIETADAVVWTAGPDNFPSNLPDSVRWVQLSSAGVEAWIDAGIVDDRRVWTSAAGAYARTVASHTIMLLLAGVRGLPAQLAATSWRKDEFDPLVGTLDGATVAIVGCGGIGRALIPFLHAAGADVLAVTRSGVPVAGAVDTLPADRTGEAWTRADHVVIAAPATSATAHLVDAAALDKLGPRSWVVNVARGSLIDTEAATKALQDNRIGGLALDVTDPEPLPDGHPLWSLPNAIITPHIANPASGLSSALAKHIGRNVEKFTAGDELDARIDLSRGY
ncbi:D-isomer specific 2-hydroxyacid dehydrogenase family protein [Rhodococcus sp. IEGM 1330]|uniref:D-isomer specific 2-hydroxyacid dehydrogenase family protein n=1 Tax=Rhodococcus sp. IEGM 1330 TaxID=3082225 RepID=UPI00295446D9|nr:D-isomer specific 2-hydroxyacid dehydrogenase family protein [Rhodococcus sp. IEGM 1330]MDV8025247.1 D-isomer specific 2-hydroxyacid dehydrogenase family protein [Rhodococcus sp. IEGM 1330]